MQRFEFVNLDDPSYVSESPVVRAGLTWPGVRWAFTSKDSYAGNPLTTVSYLATDSHAQYRNGNQAMALAARAVELTRTNYPAALDTLAAAYAEQGQFADAVGMAKLAAARAESMGEPRLAEEINARLKLYESSQPFHVPPVR